MRNTKVCSSKGKSSVTRGSESYQLALCNTQIINIEYGIAIIYLFEILNLNHLTLNFEF